MNQIHDKLSVWARLHGQLKTLEAGLRSTGEEPGHGTGADTSAMEVELRALRAKVDNAFNVASAAIHGPSRSGRDGPTAARSHESGRQTQARRQGRAGEPRDGRAGD